MKLASGAVLLAISGAVYAIPLPVGVLDNVQDDCSGMGPGCVAAGPFLHHLTNSEDKYLHLIHPTTGQVVHVARPTPPTNPLPVSSMSEEDEEPSTTSKPPAGVYPNSNHPYTSTPFKDPPLSINSGSNLQGSMDPARNGAIPGIGNSNNTVGAPNGKPASSLMDASSLYKSQGDDEDIPPTPATSKLDGTPVAPNATMIDPLAKGTVSPLPITANQSTPDGGDIKSTGPLPDLSATPNSTKVADATGVAQAPNLLRINNNRPDQNQKSGALRAHKDVLVPLCSVVLASAGAMLLL